MAIDDSKIKQRVSNLFSYLKELKKRLDEAIIDQSKYDWTLRIDELPAHPYIQVSLNEERILTIKRPKEIKCPLPPDDLLQWLKNGWQKIRNDAEVLESKNIEDEEGKTKTIYFSDHPQLIEDYDNWNSKRNEWKNAELPSEEVRNIFSKLHELKGRIDKDSEKIDFLITNGILSTDSPNGKINHPLILQSVSLTFDSTKDDPEFIIERSEKEPYLYVEALRRAEVNGSHLIQKKEEFETNPLLPDSGSDIKGYLKSLVHFLWQDGEFHEDKVEAIKSDKTTILYDISFILGKRNDHFFEQIDEYLQKISGLETIPLAFKNIVGAFDDDPPSLEGISVDTISTNLSGKTKSNYYLTKEYNHEQKRIIDALNSNGCVSVQGPPGTGKSHTIANLIGHLLAEGKRVLVSSYTTKALNVIREKVVSELRPLCVSVLDQDAESKRQLQESVSFINSIVLNSNTNALENEIKVQETKRNEIENRVEKLKCNYVDSIYSEYKAIGYLGEAILPKDAAKFIAKQREKLFKGPFLTEAPPITNKEFEEVIHLIQKIDSNDYNALLDEHPYLENLISPIDFNKLLELKKINSEKISNIETTLKVALEKSVESNILHVHDIVIALLNSISSFDIGQLRILDVCLRGSDYRAYVEETYREILNGVERIEKSKPIIFKHNPSFNVEHDIDALISVLDRNFTNDKKNGFSMFGKMFSKEIRLIEEHAKVKNRKPTTIEEYTSVMHFLLVKKERQIVRDSFHYEVVSKYQLDLTICEQEPELHISEFLRKIKTTIAVADEIREFFSLAIEYAYPWPSPSANSLKLQYPADMREIKALKVDLESYLLPALQAYLEKLELEKLSLHIEATSDYLKNYKNRISMLLLESLKKEDVTTYKENHEELQRLEALMPLHNRLHELIIKTSQSSNILVNMFIERSILNLSIPNFDEHWKASYLSFKLDEYNSIDTNEIKDKIDELQTSLKKLSSSLIKNLTVLGQLKRTKQEHRQALIAWVQLQNSITKSGKGKLDSFKRKEAKELIKKAQNAVPVWIMPLARVLDNFRLVDDSFDVLIIDEASQADLTYLPILAIAKKVIIVGDDKQVSPAAAGKSLDGLENLILEFLGDIPGRANFSYKYSLFDIACSSFGEKIPLKEHFRCVPAIIQFCNELSYDGAIKVLREESSSNLQPPIVPFYIPEARSESFVNEKEAYYIVAAILEMIQDVQYKNKSFGVISLKGPKQHILIDQLLREHLTSKQYEEHRILCGKAPQFQGDERDVIFLSLVDAPNSPDDVLTKISDTEDRKKEFNVAVSRAKDQLWIIHSMAPDSQLKPDDLRLRLLRHAKDPRSLIEKHSHYFQLAESPFEKSVHEDLIRAGYKFIPQYEVGAYRIDIVLKGADGTRVALECDGEKYHSTEEQVRNDFERQSVLERLGFKFLRIRGSNYYRNKEQTMNRLFSELPKYGVLPIYDQEEIASTKYEPPVDLIKKIQQTFENLFSESEDELDEKKIS